MCMESYGHKECRSTPQFIITAICMACEECSFCQEIKAPYL